ncbi:Protein transport protein S9 plasma membrane t-SNARE [Tulasnella sp. JGI-2019a]|nr:Protein transport protein S9 plasma membrane t-SNARE [Tulasnella sp. JGI-2019a]
MSFFRRKDRNEIPLPPSRDQSQPNVLRKDPGPGPTGPPSYRSNASSYNQQQTPLYRPSPSSNNSYGDQKDPNAYDNNGGGGGYVSRNTAPIGDPYSRGFGNVEADRNELFSGYNADRAAAGGGGRNRFDDRPGGPGGASRWQDRQPGNQEEEEEDVESIKKDTRALKTDSVNSTRNALRLAREAEETARNTLLKLGDQSEKIANTERHLDQSKGYTTRAEDRTTEIKVLNRSIFRPAITFNKEGKRIKEEQRLADRHAAEREERERAMMDVRESHGRIGRANNLGRGDEDTYGADEDLVGGGGGGSGRFGRGNMTQAQRDARSAGRSRFQFEKSASDDELEDELDDNLNEIGDVSKRLKALALAQGQELDTQNERLTRLDGNTVKLDDQLIRATDRLKRIK